MLPVFFVVKLQLFFYVFPVQKKQSYRMVKKCLQDGAETAINIIGELYYEDKSAHFRN